MSDTRIDSGRGEEGARSRGMSPIHRAAFPSQRRVGTNARKSPLHQGVNSPFVAVYYSYKDSGHASLTATIPSSKRKVGLKNTARIRIQDTAEQAGCAEGNLPVPRGPLGAEPGQLPAGLPCCRCAASAQWAPAALALLHVPLCDRNKRRSWKPSATAQL